MAQQTAKVREFFVNILLETILAFRAVAIVFPVCTTGEIILRYSCANAALSFHQRMEVMMLDLGDKETIKFKIKVNSFRFRNILDFSVFFFSSHFMHLLYDSPLPTVKIFQNGFIKMLHYSHWYWCVF